MHKLLDAMEWQIQRLFKKVQVTVVLHIRNRKEDAMLFCMGPEAPIDDFVQLCLDSGDWVRYATVEEFNSFTTDPGQVVDFCDVWTIQKIIKII